MILHGNADTFVPEFFGDDFPPGPQDSQFWAAVSKLEDDHTFFIIIPENLSDEKKAAGSVTWLATFY